MQKFPYVGRYGDEILIRDLPNELRTDAVIAFYDEYGTAFYDDSLNKDQNGVIVCGSPNEVANDRSLGYHFGAETGYDTKSILTRNYRKYVWMMIVLAAPDQLRQRVAWALCQILVVVKSAVDSEFDNTEWFLHYYDIFVRHAFGNYRDMLREISFSPIMAENLSFLRSKSTAYIWETQRLKAYADENFAREIMQLFTMGTVQLNIDGSAKLDDEGDIILAYTNEDIMSFSRAWTGFDYQSNRGNIEGYNKLDPMKIEPSWRDKFPKTALYKGRYIGDTYPLCVDYPSKSFLRTGATYRLLGSSSLPELMTDPPEFATDETIKRVVLNETSALRELLCHRDLDGQCQYQNSVTLESKLACTGIECDVDVVRVVQVTSSVFFEYVHPPCVQQAFFNDAKKLSKRYSVYSTVCANPLLPVASEACCEVGSVSAIRNTMFDGERMTFRSAEKRCSDISRETCDFYSVSGDSRKNSMAFWTPGLCLLRIKVKADGQVAIVHEPSRYTKREPHVDYDNENWFPINWDTSYPKASNDCDGACQVLEGGYCLCNTAVQQSRIFGGTPKSILEAMSKLYVGAPDPRIYDDGIYNSTLDIDTNITVHLKNNKFSSDTIFEFTDNKGFHRFMKNIHEEVEVKGIEGTYTGYSFRNVPHFMSFIPAETTVRDAQYETEAVLDHYFYHDNTAPFICIRLIQRLVISNPSPRYIRTVSVAFIEGKYEYDGIAFGTGKYGDMASTIAAILLDREARNMQLDKDLAYGSLREPLLKFISLMRSMDFVSKQPITLISSLENIIGQMPHSFESVFSFFLPEFQPSGRIGVASLVAPEASICLDMPKIVALLNGMFSLVKYGLSDRRSGFGKRYFGGDNDGILKFNKTVTKPVFSYETFEGLSLRGGYDHVWVGDKDRDPHMGRVVFDPTLNATDGIKNHVLTLEREHIYNGFAYSIRTNSLSWDDHEAAAIAWGGHLASIQNSEERDFIYNVVNRDKSYWLGGKRKEGGNATDGSAYSWEWADGTPWNFTNWYGTEPNSLRECCLHQIGRGNVGWNDLRSSYELYAIYKKPIGFQVASLSSSEFHSPLFTPEVNATYVVKFRYLSHINSTAGGCIGHTINDILPLESFILCDDGGSGNNTMVSQGEWITCKFDVSQDASSFRIGIVDRSLGPVGFYFDDIQIVHVRDIGGEYGTGPTCNGVELEKKDPPGAEGYSDAVISELSTLLTAGRLDDDSLGIIRSAFDVEQSADDGLRVAQELIVTTSEFHSTNIAKRKKKIRDSFSFPEPSGKPYRAVVNVMFSGGCDSFNMLVPYSCTKGKDLEAEYKFIRQKVAIPRQGLTEIRVENQVCETFGIHKELAVAAKMYKAGDLLFFTNTGVLTTPVNKENYTSLTKTQLFAHTTMRRESKRMDPNDLIGGTGTLGRMSDALLGKGRKVGLFSVDKFQIALSGRPGPGFSDAPFIVSRNGVPDIYISEETKETIYSLHNETESDSGYFAETWSSSLLKSFDSNELLGAELLDISTSTIFPETSFGQKLEIVSKLIATRDARGVDTDMFYVEIGGFDTHADVELNLQTRFIEVNDAFAAFEAELKNMTLWNNVTTIQVSDFARTLNPNSGDGTDHAWGGNYMMFGGSVKGGQVLGTYPDDLTDDGPNTLGRGRLIPTTSWDACFTSIASWLGIQKKSWSSICPNCFNFPESHFFDPNDVFHDIPLPAPTASPPTDYPTTSPSEGPSKSLHPSISLSTSPSVAPTFSPSNSPSDNPSRSHSNAPLKHPSRSHSNAPSKHPSITFSTLPSVTPSLHKSMAPSLFPSKLLSYSPSKNPTPISSMSPSATPTIPVCKENANVQFLFKVKPNGKAVLGACSWLAAKTEKSEKSSKKICLNRVDYLATDTETFSPAQIVCKLTCESCDPCYENPSSKYFRVLKDDSPVTSTCAKLTGTAVKKYCSRSASGGGYPSAKVVCPVTCSSITGQCLNV